MKYSYTVEQPKASKRIYLRKQLKEKLKLKRKLGYGDLDAVYDKDLYKGTYAGLRFSEESKDKIMKLCEFVPNSISRDDIHCTLLYSRKHLPNYIAKGSINETAKVNGYKIFETQDGSRALVLTLESDFIINRFNELMKTHDATYDYDEYIPHITISYDIGDFGIDSLNFNESLDIIEEYKKDLKLDWGKDE